MSLFDTEGVLFLDVDRRVSKRYATLKQFREHLAFNGENDRDLLVLALLRPYWDDGRTMAEAVQQWRGEHLGFATTTP